MTIFFDMTMKIEPAEFPRVHAGEGGGLQFPSTFGGFGAYDITTLYYFKEN